MNKRILPSNGDDTSLEKRARVVQLLDEAKPHKAIAREIGVSPRTVRRIAHQLRQKRAIEPPDHTVAP